MNIFNSRKPRCDQKFHRLKLSIILLWIFLKTAVTAQATCGGEIRSEALTLLSPRDAGKYPNNRVCVWEITLCMECTIILKFIFFKVEYHDRCEYDYIEIRDGNSEDSPLIGKYCGYTIPDDIKSTGRHLYVKFVSNGSVQKKGFEAYIVKVSPKEHFTFKITTPKPDNLAYYHHPVTGFCSCSPTSDACRGGGVVVKFNSGSDISGDEMELARLTAYDYPSVQAGAIVNWTENGETMLKILHKPVPDPFDSNHTKRVGVMFKYCVSEALRETSFVQCFMFNENGVTAMDRIKITADYRVEKPLLVVRYHMKPSILLLHEMVSISCSALVGSDGSMTLLLPGTMLGSQGWTIFWNRTENDVESNAPNPDRLNYYKEWTKWGPRISALLWTKVTIQFHGLPITCLASNPKEKFDKVSKREVEVRYYPQKPIMVVKAQEQYRPFLVWEEWRSLWFVRGSCRVPQQEADKLRLVFKTSALIFIQKGLGPQGLTKRHHNRRIHDNVARSNFWTEWQNETEQVFVHFFVKLLTESGHVVLTCAGQNLEVCKTVEQPTYKHDALNYEEQTANVTGQKWKSHHETFNFIAESVGGLTLCFLMILAAVKVVGPTLDLQAEE